MLMSTCLLYTSARFIEIDADEHDRVTSQISHFPHILASGLMEQTASYAEEHEMARRFAACLLYTSLV